MLCFKWKCNVCYVKCTIIGRADKCSNLYPPWIGVVSNASRFLFISTFLPEQTININRRPQNWGGRGRETVVVVVIVFFSLFGHNYSVAHHCDRGKRTDSSHFFPFVEEFEVFAKLLFSTFGAPRRLHSWFSKGREIGYCNPKLHDLRFMVNLIKLR